MYHLGQDLPGNDVDDIEDLISADDVKPRERYENKKTVTVRAKKRSQIRLESQEEEEKPKPTIHESVIPGTQKVL